MFAIINKLILICACVNGNMLDWVANRLDPDGNGTMNSDSFSFKKSAIDLIQGNGYPAEVHEVQTEDGYLLTLHRIPYGREQPVAERPVVLIHHGLGASADLFLVTRYDKTLVFILADNGYDVWLTNCRGSFYSRKHVTLDPDRDEKFWNYSMHEIGIYDIPASIDYILNVTNQKDLMYVGHSMGNNVFFIMTSMKPKYNSKIRLMVGLAPAVFFTHSLDEIDFIIKNGNSIFKLMLSQGYYELFPLREVSGRIGRVMCSEESVTQLLCISLASLLFGTDHEQFNNTLIPILMDHYPTGASIYQLAHYLQGIIKRDFRQVDFGKKINLRKYKHTEPPAYNLSKVTIPVALYYGANDNLTNKKDTEKLASMLPNVVGINRIPNFNHISFLFGIDVKTLLYDQVLELMNKYR